jgi:LPS-assembly lipoprotein
MSWSRRKFLAGSLALAALPALAGCGFKPLYGYRDDPSGGAPARLAEVRIVPIAERAGQLLYIDLRERLNPLGVPDDPRWVLETELIEQQENLLIARDETATRTNVILRAEFTLTRIVDNAIVFSGVSQASIGYNILDNQFATISSEQDARARGVTQIGHDMTTRLAVYMSSQETAAQP